MTDVWIDQVEQKILEFANDYGIIFSHSVRQVAASFEIGCFHSLTEFYSKYFILSPQNLTDIGEYKYLTTPSGNPENFSYVKIEGKHSSYELRQQVRIISHLDSDISVTPDLVVIFEDTEFHANKRSDYASGKRPFYCVDSKSVVAIHECKSMVPFPELLVGFIGMLTTTHCWFNAEDPHFKISDQGQHLAPTLFIGGDARSIHLKMIAALERTYPINIAIGFHIGTFSLFSNNRRLRLLEES